MRRNQVHILENPMMTAPRIIHVTIITIVLAAVYTAVFSQSASACQECYTIHGKDYCRQVACKTGK